MKPIEKLLGMPIVSLEEGRRLGTLEGVEIDPARARIAYLRLKPEGHQRRSVFLWDDVQSIGQDAIMVSSSAVLRPEVPAEERQQLTPQLGDRPVVTESGQKLGTVKSYDVDELTGRIHSYRVGGLFAGLVGGGTTFPTEAIRTFGRDAIIVEDAVRSEHDEAKAA